MSSILIAEDDDHLAALMLRAVTGAGHRAERVSDGKAALDAIRSGRFALVLLDVGLPTMNGMEVLVEVRQTLPSLPVLLVTAENAPARVVHGLTAGADDYITKPFRFDELLARIETRLRSARNSDTLLTGGGVVLDLVARTASGPTGVVELPAREFELLEFFLRRPGRTIGRDELLRGIWGYDPATSSNVVDVYVRYLRQKLGAGVIETVWGAGYRLGG